MVAVAILASMSLTGAQRRVSDRMTSTTITRLLDVVADGLPVFPECQAFAEREIEIIKRQAFTIDSLRRLSR